MAQLALQVASVAAAAVPGGQPFAVALQVASQTAGKLVDSKLFGGSGKTSGVTGPQLSDLSVQTSTYGKMIPVLYGESRIAGNVIWARPMKEIATTTTTSSGGGKGGGGGSSAKQSRTDFSYFTTMAIAICEGEIDEILRVWADAKVIDPKDFSGSYKLYKGTETQLPDPVIESFEGAGNVPAYRGISYVVIEDFPLADFGNRIPNFTFEVKRRSLSSSPSETPTEDLIKSIVVIPGSGEFVYDTTVQQKVDGEQVGSQFIQGSGRNRINQNNRQSKADPLVSLDQLEDTCRNLEWISVVAVWFGDSLDAGTCLIRPGVEYKVGSSTEPDLWQVGSFNRNTAYLISTDANGRASYGGTPSDAGLLRYLDEIKNRGYNIMFYPMFFMDTEDKPWRGRLTGTSSNVASFFTKTSGYNAFINHYASLVKDKVDAFVIGSELVGLTKVQDVDDSFPAVDELVSLAATVKTTVGSGVKVTYAADWSEYHHTDGGWYNLDSLWASPNIDFVGIDAYFPLTDEPQNGYDEQNLIDGWVSGEGFDWVYTDETRTVKDFTLQPAYAWKNIDWWWKNSHVNPDMTTTAWVPQSKKIWFTEYGFPSVDGASNEPNVFFDPESSESKFPRFSKGRVDFRAQRLGITATEKQWKDSTMVERRFLWTWDARPFPFWPDLLEVWSDGGLWKKGHWVQGKLGLSSLAAIVSDLCIKSGLLESDFDVTRLKSLVDGYIVSDQTTGRSAIENLQKAYFFDSVESDGILKFVPREGVSSIQISENELIPEKKGTSKTNLSITSAQEIELPRRVSINYVNKTFDYLVGTQYAQRIVSKSLEFRTINLPLVLPDQVAKNIADITLFNSWLGRTGYKFSLTQKYSALEPTDIIEVTSGSAAHKIRITNISMGKPGVIQVNGVAEDLSVYQFNSEAGTSVNLTDIVKEPGETRLEILDLPPFPADTEGQGILRFAAAGLESAWNGSIVYRSDDDGVSYQQIAITGEPSIIGTATNIPGGATPNIFDYKNRLTVLVLGGELESVTDLAVLNGANVAKIGNEIIQFKNATLISQNKYELTGLLRGRLGTEGAIDTHTEAETFVLLDSRLAKIDIPNSLIGLGRKYKPVSIGSTLSQTTEQSFVYSAESLKPYSPVHIKGMRDGSGNLTVSWVRRTRMSGDWRDRVDVPLGEEKEEYEIDIMNSGSVVRKVIVSNLTQTIYSAAEQITDFGSVQSSVSVVIYQMSSAVGRGNAASASV